MRNLLNKTVVSILILFLLLLTSCMQKETKSPLETRINAILASMTVQEKIEQLYYKTDGNARLGVKQFTGSDGPHGVGSGAKGFSCFPVTLAMAATWDPELIMRAGRAISLEQAARGRDRIAGPVLDLLVDPRNGRAPETIGEDPFLGGRISEAFILGQNTTPVFGSIKHYNLNTFEFNRRTNNYLSDERSLVEFWGYHWKRAVQAGGAMSVMCAYNWVNGDKCAENGFMIKDLLRDHWGFRYYTMCDWGGFSSTEKALDAQLDFCEGNDLYIKELPEGVKTGRFDSSKVERAARNILRTKLVSGMIDGVAEIPASVIDSKEHRDLVYETGLKGLVLLKNADNILPLKKEVRSIAVIGPNASVLPLDGNSSSKVNPSYRIPVLDAIKKWAGEEKVTFAKGCNINDTDRSHFREAVAAARNSEYVVFVGGLDQTMEGEGYFLFREADESGGEFKVRPDRISQSVLLPGMQNELIKALAKVNPNIILVVISGGTCSVTPVIQDIKGLIYAFYPGQEGGRAIADVLFGHYNPSGKMPATMPKDDSQLRPISPDFRDMVYKGVGYRWFDSQNLNPEFAFGYGLSYTTFEYADIKIANSNPKTGDIIKITFDLKNTGIIPGEEVCQLYVTTGNIDPAFPMPVKQLRGFKKVLLNPGEIRSLTFELTPEDLYVWNEKSRSYQVPQGDYTIRAGGSSDNLPLKAQFHLMAAAGMPDLSVRNIRTVPPYPKEGEEVILLVSLINNGTAATKTGDPIAIRFCIDGKEVAGYFSKSISIPAGGMELACAEGIKWNSWKAARGEFRITTEVMISGNSDLNPANNKCEAVLKIPGGKAIPAEIAAILKQPLP
jgi:beta-glucosidase